MKTNINVNLHDIDIKKQYASILKNWDCIVNKKVFHLYNKDIPKISDFININGDFFMIKKIEDDGVSYLINYENYKK